jgi:hypothetical protein
MNTDTAETTPRDEVDQRTSMARGHLARTGHKLTGHYVPTTDVGIVRLVRTCACAGRRGESDD